MKHLFIHVICVSLIMLSISAPVGHAADTAQEVAEEVKLYGDAFPGVHIDASITEWYAGPFYPGLYACAVNLSGDCVYVYASFTTLVDLSQGLYVLSFFTDYYSDDRDDYRHFSRVEISGKRFFDVNRMDKELQSCEEIKDCDDYGNGRQRCRIERECHMAESFNIMIPAEMFEEHRDTGLSMRLHADYGSDDIIFELPAFYIQGMMMGVSRLRSENSKVRP